jgi:tRNA A-37 threonylcarbamoyl transferase component Bud32/tetratricopeptide (TPR) repeat protein
MKSPSTIEAEALPVGERRAIDAACDRFEAAWRGGERPDLGDFLRDAHGPARAVLFRELLALEREYRLGEPEPPAAAAYRARFPEHAGLIAAAFASDADETQVSRPSPDAIIDLSTTWSASSSGRPIGDAGDPTIALAGAGYDVESELGRGGMGVVYRAYQPALGRAVAVKLIRAGGLASEGDRRRFRNEAEAVAQLDHPHIVPIYEVGEARGHDYFSMKLVEGAGLDRRLAEFHRDPRATARLVAQIAEAVHHAHERGILHRDLKPANVLVDGRGEPHVTDFGLARRIDSALDLTHSGAIVGTPSYMSPEQAAGARGGYTTATDVYGLGAILYAVLTGRAPHAGSSLAETLDKVREVPPEPPSRVNAGVPRDLEVICLKCLEKEPGRRYASAQALADDLGRWLDGLPITARPVGPLTRARMWCRRHPLPAALAAMLVVSGLVGSAAVAWKWREAVGERTRAGMIADFLANRVLAESSTEVNPAGAKLTALDLLDRASGRIGGDFQGYPDVEASIRETIGRSYLSLGEYARAEPHLRKAIDLDAAHYGPGASATLRATNALAVLLDESGKVGDAELLLRSNLATARRALGPDDPIALEAADRLGALLRKSGRLDEAEPLLREALAARRRVLPTDHPDTLRSVRNLSLLDVDRERFAEAEALADEYERGIRCARGPKHPDNVAALANRGLIRLLQGKPAEAEPFYRRAAEESARILGPDHPTTRTAVAEHARIARDAGPAHP